MIEMKLTETEQKIYDAICIDGIFSQKELAKKLCIGVTTIRTHLVHIYQKKYCNGMRELIHKHYQKNIIEEKINARIKQIDEILGTTEIGVSKNIEYPQLVFLNFEKIVLQTILNKELNDGK